MRKFIDVGKKVIDKDQIGKIGVVLFNLANKNFSCKSADRFTQLILKKTRTPTIYKIKVLSATKKGQRDFRITQMHFSDRPVWGSKKEE